MQQEAEWKEEVARFQRLLNTDATKAVEEARRVASSSAEVDSVAIAASILIDGGRDIRNAEAVQDGIDLFLGLRKRHGNRPEWCFNIGNGYSALVDLANHDPLIVWVAETLPHRTRARREFWTACTAEAATTELQARAWTNIGNSLWHSKRWIEALDCYARALQVDAGQGAAAGRTAEILLACCRDDDDSLRRVVGGYARLAQEAAHSVLECLGPRGVKKFASLQTSDYKPDPFLRRTDLEPYDAFVIRHRLALSPIPEAVASPSAWDRLHVRAFTEEGGTGQVPPVFAMFNLMKARFLLSRRMLYEGLRALEGNTDTDGEFYMDTLDYALYGEASEKVLTAQRIAADILDMIAGAVNHWLSIGLPARGVEFASFFMKSERKTPAERTYRWKKQVLPALRENDAALVALADLSADVGFEGHLHHLAERRNAGTHRFVVLHDPYVETLRTGGTIEHRSVREFKKETIYTLGIVRAGLLYFLQAVEARERSWSGTARSLILPMFTRRMGTGA